MSQGREGFGAVGRDVGAIAGLFGSLSLVYLSAVDVVCGRPGLPLDDAFIHLQFARNLYEHGQMAFNEGVPSSGSTAPIYPVLLAAAYAVIGDWYWASFAIGSACSLGTALVAYGLLRSWTGRRDLARWGGLLTVAASPTVMQAFSGMESPVYSFCFMVALWCYGWSSWRLLASAILALTVWLRPEFMGLLPLIVLEEAVGCYRGGRGRFRRFIDAAARHGLIWAAILAAYVAYHRHQDGHWVPSTFAAKAVVHFPLKPAWLDGLPAAIRYREWGQGLLAVLVWPVVALFLAGVGLASVCVPLGFGLRDALASRWRDRSSVAAGWRLGLLTLIGYPWLRGLVDSLGLFWNQGQRYYAHLTPLVVVLVLGSLPATGAILRRPRWDWRGVPYSSQCRRALAWAAGGSVLTGILAVVSVSNIMSMQVPIAEWLRAHTRPGELVAANDIGAIGFISRRPVLDTVGLVEPQIVRHYLAGGTLLDYLRRRSPAYVVIFPNWYRELSGQPKVLQPQHSVRLAFNVVCGGSEMVVYRPTWSSPPRG